MGSFDVQIVGGQELTAFARRMREAPKKVQAATRRKLNAAVRPLQTAIRAEVGPTMPAGYESVLSRSLRFRTSLKTGHWAAVTLTTSAKGRRENRHVRALDKGILRHPRFGDREFWYAQQIKPGFWTRPVRAHKPRVVRDVSKVIVDSLRDSVKG